ncbi:helix-turn-helix domain-containing protein [Rhodocyclus tenuis]|uniref:Biotin operon repressor n=1 Tax=Rhodocyclus tenuis TaxID=1066 RepID=A0A840FYT1_RHOTE|nr:HTH domain-containing protein [Rhodocyclus tenuis]MBB4247277.1 biotin operon repressor [Rhodocyclus tenuis]
MPPIKPACLAALSQHIGASKGITAAALARQLHAGQRGVRTAITDLRMDGVAVCGHPRSGYYIAENAAELEETCRFLDNRALHSLTLASRLRRVPLADLLGQLKLRT